MTDAMRQSSGAPRTAVGCVSFLNSKPLIDGLDDHPALRVSYDVPSALLADLLDGRVDLALCPVIDYQLSSQPLAIVPVGGICCRDRTHTVRLFSRAPIQAVRQVAVDPDSHTSVNLLRVILHDAYGLTPRLVELDRRAAARRDWPESVLLIGDKVVLDGPDEAGHPHQLDLGLAWRRLTGLPFVFAVWMARLDSDLGDAPAILDRQRIDNAARIDSIVARHAPAMGWPIDLARRYLGQLLHYHLGPEEFQAMRRFWTRTHELRLTPADRPLRTRPAPTMPRHGQVPVP
jgi:chorismate dehydratase